MPKARRKEGTCRSQGKARLSLFHGWQDAYLAMTGT